MWVHGVNRRPRDPVFDAVLGNKMTSEQGEHFRKQAIDPDWELDHTEVLSTAAPARHTGTSDAAALPRAPTLTTPPSTPPSPAAPASAPSLATTPLTLQHRSAYSWPHGNRDNHGAPTGTACLDRYGNRYSRYPRSETAARRADGPVRALREEAVFSPQK